MIISDLQHIETATEAQINGGVAAYTGVNVSAYGGSASADAFGAAFGENTGAKTLVGTRTASGNGYQVSAATGAATSYAVTVDGKNSRVATSVATGVATSVNTY
jgi:hypothetical protein